MVIRKNGYLSDAGWLNPSSIASGYNAMVDGTRRDTSGTAQWSTVTRYLCNFYTVYAVSASYSTRVPGRRTYSFKKQENGVYYRRNPQSRMVELWYDQYDYTYSESEAKSFSFNPDDPDSVMQFIARTEPLAKLTPKYVSLSRSQTSVNWLGADVGITTDIRDLMLYKVASDYLDIGVIPNSIARGLETAYTRASESLPEAATNLAANIIEAAEMLSAIFRGDVSGIIPSTAREAWLSYRYVYTTTKLDVGELQSAFTRIADIASYDTISVYGAYTRGGITYRVGYDIDPAQILPEDVSSTMQSFGLSLSWLNVWDMIPYSFIVDWFIPIGTLIEYFQSLDACRLKPKDIWWSFTMREGDTDIYVRLPGRPLITYPYLSIAQTSRKTVFLRIADTIALFT